MAELRKTYDAHATYAPWLNFALGIAVIITPWIGNVATNAEKTSDVITGIIMCIVALVAFFATSRSASNVSIINILAGIWLWISIPFTSDVMMHWQHVVYGCMAIITALIAMGERAEVRYPGTLSARPSV
ncbi:MAG: SPW repeat domain-containing protein [Candidatus Xenobia bacterium]